MYRYILDVRESFLEEVALIQALKDYPFDSKQYSR